MKDLFIETRLKLLKYLENPNENVKIQCFLEPPKDEMGLKNRLQNSNLNCF